MQEDLVDTEILGQINNSKAEKTSRVKLIELSNYIQSGRI